MFYMFTACGFSIASVKVLNFKRDGGLVIQELMALDGLVEAY